MPMMYCQISTEIPNDAPSDSTTVPTITSAATRLRVISNMIRKIRQIDAMPAISRSYLEPSAMSLNVAAVPPREIFASSSGVPLTASIAAILIGSTRERPSGVSRIAAMRDDHPHRFAVRREEALHAALEVRIRRRLPAADRRSRRSSLRRTPSPSTSSPCSVRPSGCRSPTWWWTWSASSAACFPSSRSSGPN